MVRPREGEGLKRLIVKRGDKLYAYEVTSEMVDGEKTVSRYLGRVDPEINELMEKIPENSKAYREKISMQRSIKVLEDIRVGDYGETYLLDQIQRSIHLGDQLDEAFGNAATPMLTVGIGLIYSDGIFDSVEGSSIACGRRIIMEWRGPGIPALSADSPRHLVNPIVPTWRSSSVCAYHKTRTTRT